MNPASPIGAASDPASKQSFIAQKSSTQALRSPQSIRLIQLGPESILTRYGAGNWKDLQCRLLALRWLGIAPQQIGFSIEDPVAIVSQISADTTDVVLEYSGRPDLMKRLQQQCPAARIHLRMHNAEALQHWHRSELGWWPNYQNARQLYGAIRLAFLDRQSVKIADSTLGISPWDNDHYWRRLDRGPHRFLPYFSPWPYLRPHVLIPDYDDRPQRIVCMPGGGDRLSRQQAALFDSIAAQMQTFDKNASREFWISAGVIKSGANETIHTRQQPMDQPWDVLVQSRAVAILTDLGFGMKTTILDGLAAGAHVLVHAGLIPRLPAAIARVVVPVDVDDPQLGKFLVERLHQSPAAGRAVDLAMRDEAIATLADVLGVAMPANQGSFLD